MGDRNLNIKKKGGSGAAKPTAAKQDYAGIAQLIAAIPAQARLLALLALVPWILFGAYLSHITPQHVTYIIIGCFILWILQTSIFGAIMWRSSAVQPAPAQSPTTKTGDLPVVGQSALLNQELPKDKHDFPHVVKVDYSSSTIHVFLPDWKKDKNDEFYQDGAVQYQAFEQAQADSRNYVIGNLRIEYQPMTEGMLADDLLRSMKRLYTEKQATYFLMTMSSKVHCIFDAFGRWHLECKRNGKRLPVLISTVASAPGLADAQRGILRWYVRSQEESTVLAQYLRWEKKIKHTGIFFVTHRERQMNSHYGTSGKQIFKESFTHLKGETLDFAVTADDADENVKTWLQKTKEISDRAAFVIGYGGMMKRTVDALIKEEFTGPVACSSTLTRREWQPKDISYDSNIFTVLPRLKGSHEHLGGYDRDVVFFFAKETLRRVIEMTSHDPDAESFLVRWRDGAFPIHPHLPQLCEEHLSNGDSILSVEIVGSELWRT